MAAAAAIAVAGAAFGSAVAADQPAPPVDNPGLDVACGIKVAVVLDESGSIGGFFGPTDPNRADFTPQVRDAFRRFVASRFAVTDVRSPLPWTMVRATTR